MKSISQRISILEKRIGLNEDSDFEGEEEQNHFELEVGLDYALRAQEIISDIKSNFKAHGIDFQQHHSNAWTIYFEDDLDRDEVQDELENLFDERGLKEYDLS